MGKNNKFILDAMTATKVGNRVYFFGKSLNLLYYLDVNTKNIVVIGSIPDEPIISKRLVGKILAIDNRLVILPLLGKKIWIVDMDNNMWNSVELKYTDFLRNMFFQGHVYDNHIHMIGCEYPYIVVMDCNDYSLKYDDRLFNELEQKERSGGDIFFRSDYVRRGNEVIIGCCASHYLLKYNLSNSHYELVEQIGLPDYECISIDEACEVYTSRSTKKLMIKRNSGEVIIEDVPKNINISFMGIKRHEDKLYLFSSETGDSCVYSEKEGFKKIKKNICMFVNNGDTTIWMDTTGEINIENDGICNTYECMLDRDIVIPAFRKALNDGGVTQEGVITLESFVDEIIE